MKKLIELGENVGNTHEPVFQVIPVGNTNGLMEKRASYTSEAYEYIKTIEAKKGSTFILVIAMGAGEHYGSNRNGDFFPEKDLKLRHHTFETVFSKDGEGNRSIKSGALLYKHHKNKARKGDPWFGIVNKSFYNPHMHRVELVIEIIHSRPGAQELVDKVNSGGNFAVSMGVSIPWDECNQCGNRAKTTKAYCLHMQRELGVVKSNGKKVYAINGGYDYEESPTALTFFDISYVFRPADKQGFMLKKVAQTGHVTETCTPSAAYYEKQASLKEKTAELNKIADLIKYMEGDATAYRDEKEFKALKAYGKSFDKIVDQMEPMKRNHIEDLSKYPMNKILSTLSSMGILVSTPEIISLVFYKMTGKHVPINIMYEACHNMANVYSEMANDPELVEEAEKSDSLRKVAPDKDIMKVVDDIAESRDVTPEGLEKKATSDWKRSILDLESSEYPWGDGKGMLHTEHVRDPETGKRYSASMTAIEDGNTIEIAKGALKALAAAGLLGGAIHATKKVAPALTPLAWLASLGLGAKVIKDIVSRDAEHNYMMTESGTFIPKGTYMIEKTSSVRSKMMGFLGKTDGLADKRLTEVVNDKLKSMEPGARIGATFAPLFAVGLGKSYYDNRIHEGTAGTYRTEVEKEMDNAGRYAYHHPVLAGTAGVIGANLSLAGLSKARRAILGK